MLTTFKKKFNFGRKIMERQPFYLSKRHCKRRAIYYFYVYNQFGRRTVPKSTGFTKKSDAFNFCMNLLKNDNLMNTKIKFGNYAYRFFDKCSTWYNNNVLSGAVKESSIQGYRNYFKNHVFPYFQDMFIDKITSTIIKEFRVYLANEAELANKTINNIVAVLSIIMKQATEERVILINPCQFVKKLPNEKRRDAFTEDEVNELMHKEWDHPDAKLVTLTAAVTGMRFSEIIGLQKHQIHDGYIDVNQQCYNGEMTTVKNGDSRFVTLPKKLEKMLLNNCNGDFIFTSPIDCTKPFSRSVILRHFYKQYTKQMIETKDDRLLTFHSLRHFTNTYLMANDINPKKVDFMIGHSDGKDSMQKLYTSWKPEMYSEILILQQKLLDKLIL